MQHRQHNSQKNQIQNKRNDFLIQDTVSKIACTWPRASPALRSFGWTHCTAAVTSDRHQTAATEIFTGKKTSSVYCEALGPDHINAAAARRVAGRQAHASTTTVEHVLAVAVGPLPAMRTQRHPLVEIPHA
jgi:hypothetical protein